MTDKKMLSIVTPVYNEASNIPEFIDRVRTAIEPTGLEYEIIFAVDPSNDGTETLIRSAHRVNGCVKMIRFSRRFGQPAATLAGIDVASGDAVLVIDCDLQDPPELIPEMIERWQGGAKIVLAQRNQRTSAEPLVKRLISRVGYKFLNRFSDVPIPENTGDFRLMDRQVVEQLKRFPEANGFLRGLVSLVGFEPEVVYFQRPERHSGTTKYNAWLGSLKIGFNGVIGFSTALLNLSTIIGMLAALLSGVIAVSYIALKIAGVAFPVGNVTLVVLVLMLGGLNLVFMGVLGLYISRIYDDVRRRPRYIIEEAVGLIDLEARVEHNQSTGPRLYP